ncbi:hypothetical protein NLI96_g7395 [Meripilus lineatus]|uniref:Uncharacterized protein n=1 Tax=Meripilus lineatus TaxID=2056292 RepID=A0AAD5V1G7_9APHY|nr:hypothetical protein NLI96_g7395 [Physisporinus lineatus]
MGSTTQRLNAPDLDDEGADGVGPTSTPSTMNPSADVLASSTQPPSLFDSSASLLAVTPRFHSIFDLFNPSQATTSLAFTVDGQDHQKNGSSKRVGTSRGGSGHNRIIPMILAFMLPSNSTIYKAIPSLASTSPSLISNSLHIPVPIQTLSIYLLLSCYLRAPCFDPIINIHAMMC